MDLDIIDDDSNWTCGEDAWSAGNFGNKDAVNFCVGCVWCGFADMVLQAIHDIVSYPQDEYLDAQFCSEALAAAEIVATAKGCAPPEDFPQEALDWLKKNELRVTEELSLSARTAVDRILHNSELKELWEEGCANDEWHLTIIDLRRRLG